jgi:hypothetical protein
VERPLDPRPVVVAEDADVLDDVGDVGLVDLSLEQRHLAVGEARLRPAAQVEDDLDHVLLVGEGVDGGDDLRRQRRQERVEVVDRLAASVLWSHACPPSGRPPASEPARRRGRRFPS